MGGITELASQFHILTSETFSNDPIARVNQSIVELCSNISTTTNKIK